MLNGFQSAMQDQGCGAAVFFNGPRGHLEKKNNSTRAIEWQGCGCLAS